MIKCPNCDAAIEVDEDEVDEGESLTCDECGAGLTVVGLDPLELESDEDEDEEEEEEEEDLDYDEDEEEEEEDEEEEDWK